MSPPGPPTSPLLSALLLLVLPNAVTAFTLPHSYRPALLPTTTTAPTSLTTLYGTNRKARRLQQKQQNKNRVKKDKTKSSDDEETTSGGDAPVVTANSSPASFMEPGVGTTTTEDRPEISTVVIDEATGMEKIAQGKAVMDVVTRKAVVLSDAGPEYRLAQMFPGVDPDTRSALRFEKFHEMAVADMVDRLRDACLVSVKEGEGMTIPPHPSVSQKGIDFVLANRDHLGFRMKKTLGRLKLRAQSLRDLDGARSMRQLWKHFLTLEDHISAPFRQIVLDAESKVGPNFGNLDLKSYIGLELYERCGTYIVLKGMVCHWEKKLRDAEFVESTPVTNDNFLEVLCTGDPKRYLPNPPIIYRGKDVTRVTAMAQKMTATFVEDESLFSDLPPELRFLEDALVTAGGTELRKLMVAFCDAEGISPVALREGMRRLDQQLENMQIDPYGDLKNIVGRLCEAMAVGTDEEIDPYEEYLYSAKEDSPGWFQTYTFNHHKNSMVRFLDNARTIEKDGVGPVNDVGKQLTNDFSLMFGAGGKKTTASDIEISDKAEGVDDDGEYYRPPNRRALGRPHNLGWLELLDDEIPKGETENEGSFEADNWREIKR